MCPHRYMNRRCGFLDSLPAFNFNTGAGEYLKDEEGKRVRTDTKQLGSTLMATMLREVEDFCDPAIKDNWSLKPHQQVKAGAEERVTVDSFHPSLPPPLPLSLPPLPPSPLILLAHLRLQGWWCKSGSDLSPPWPTARGRQYEIQEDWRQDPLHGVSPCSKAISV